MYVILLQMCYNKNNTYLCCLKVERGSQIHLFIIYDFVQVMCATDAPHREEEYIGNELSILPVWCGCTRILILIIMLTHVQHHID